jgi:tetratricopeptide (TPR) repeat protein
MQGSADSIDIDSLWEYSDPAESETRFRAALASARGDPHLELLTQIARTYSMRRQFDMAHDVLNQVDSHLAGAGPGPRIRYLLERGRAFNSAGEPARAQALFVEAWAQAQASRKDGLAVDAAHMLAIACSGTPEAQAWTRRGLDLARASQDPKARSLIPAMLNNSAWDLHDTGRFDEALLVFEDAQAEWTARGRPRQIRIATWSVARCLRSLGRYDEALAIQRALDAEPPTGAAQDGYVFEEIAENLAALGKPDEARSYFRRAVDVLGEDEWFVKHEAARLDRLKSLAGSH